MFKLLYYFSKDLFKNTSWIPSVLFTPLIFLIIYIYLNGVYEGQRFIILSIQGALSSSITLGGFSIKNDIRSNTLSDFLLCKESIRKIFFLRGCTYSFWGTLPGLIYFFISVHYVNLSIAQVFLYTFLFFPSVIMSFSLLSSLFGVLFLTIKSANTMSTLIVRMIMIYGGLYIPCENLFGFKKIVMYCLPTFWIKTLGVAIASGRFEHHFVIQFLIFIILLYLLFVKTISLLEKKFSFQEDFYH